MRRSPIDYALSLLLAPVASIALTLSIKHDITNEAAQLGDRLDPLQYGQLQSFVSVLLTFGIVVLAASVLLPVLFVLHVRQLGNDRDALARVFAPVVRIYLVCVAAVLAAQGCLVLVSTYEMFAFGVMRSGFVLIVVGAIGLGMLGAGIAVLADIRRMLERTPVQVTGVVVDAQRWPSLHARISSTVSRLKMSAPDHIVISLAPQTFATAGVVRLRGERELDEGVTLCISAPELRVLDERELDAAIAAALGTLNEGVDVSRKLIPSYRSLVDCVTFFERDDPDHNRWFKAARIPANGFLAAMLSASRAAMRKVATERSRASKRATFQVSSAKVWAASLAKASILHARWALFRSAYEAYMLRGQTRGNLSADFVAHIARFAQRSKSADWVALADTRVPHPFDVSPTFSEEMVAHAIDTGSLMRDALAALGASKAPDTALPVIEARLTEIENDYFRVPGRRVAPDERASTPVELLTVGESAS